MLQQTSRDLVFLSLPPAAKLRSLMVREEKACGRRVGLKVVVFFKIAARSTPIKLPEKTYCVPCSANTPYFQHNRLMWVAQSGGNRRTPEHQLVT